MKEYACNKSFMEYVVGLKEDPLNIELRTMVEDYVTLKNEQDEYGLNEIEFIDFSINIIIKILRTQRGKELEIIYRKIYLTDEM